MAFHALADYQNHVIGWLQWEQSSLGDGAVVRFPRIWMSSGECRSKRIAVNDAQMTRSNFTGAIFNQAQMHRANLRNAMLVDADVRAADLLRADLRDTDLTG